MVYDRKFWLVFNQKPIFLDYYFFTLRLVAAQINELNENLKCWIFKFKKKFQMRYRYFDYFIVTLKSTKQNGNNKVNWKGDQERVVEATDLAMAIGVGVGDQNRWWRALKYAGSVAHSLGPDGIF